MTSPSEYELAERNFETAIEIKTDYDECHYFFGKLLAKGEKMNKDGTLVIEPQLDRANEQFNEAIRINPKNYKAHYQLGLLLYQQKDYLAAFDSLQEVIKINPQFAEGHYQLAVLLMDEQAQQAFGKRRKKSRNSKTS